MITCRKFPPRKAGGGNDLNDRLSVSFGSGGGSGKPIAKVPLIILAAEKFLANVDTFIAATGRKPTTSLFDPEDAPEEYRDAVSRYFEELSETRKAAGVPK